MSNYGSINLLNCRTYGFNKRIIQAEGLTCIFNMLIFPSTEVDVEFIIDEWIKRNPKYPKVSIDQFVKSLREDMLP